MSANIKLYFLIFILSICSISLQANKVDSLLIELNKAAEYDKTDILLQLSQIYRSKSLDTAKLYTNQSLQIALALEDKKKIAQTYAELGMVHIMEGQYKEAIEIIDKGLLALDDTENETTYQLIHNKGSALVYSGELDEGLKFFYEALSYHETKKDTMKIAGLLNNIGVIHFHKGEYEKAMQKMIESAEMYENAGQESSAADNYGNIAMIYNESGDYHKAVEYSERSLQLYIQTEDYYSQTGQLINLANIYKNTDSLDKSILYLKRALKNAKENSYINFEALAYSNLGNVYEKQGLYNKAAETILNSINVYKQTGDAIGEAKNLRFLGRIYKNQGNYQQALLYLNKSESISEKIKLISEYYEIWLEKSEVYELMNNPGKSLDYYKKYISAKDSIFNEEKNRQITEIETKYQTEKKEKELIELTAENDRNKLTILKNIYFLYSLFAMIMLILLTGFFLFRENRIKNRQKTLELEQKLFRSQMNPHFIFNSLAAIQFYITKNKPIEASAFLSDFAKLMRLVIENSREEYISLDQEIETMKYYLEMQKLRFENNFSDSFEVDKNLEIDYVMIPPMLTQPFIENALEHAFTNKRENNQLFIRYHQENGYLNVEVEDNGIGRKEALKQKNPKHKSFALSVTKSRLEKLNRRKSQKIHFELIDLKSGTGEASGTKVKFSIPLKLAE